MERFIEIITNNYKKIIKNNHVVKKDRAVENLLFFNEIKGEIKRGTIADNDFKTFSEFIKNILIKPNMYEKLKQLTINELVLGNKIKKDDLIFFFGKLEENGFNSFGSIVKNDKIKKLLNGELKNIYSTEFSNNYNTITDNILNINNVNTCINSGILLMLEFFNSCTFMPFDVFTNIKDDESIIRIYKNISNNNLNNVYLLSDRSNTIVEPNKIQLLSKIMSITIDSLNELFNMKNNIRIDLILYAINSKKKFPINKNDIINETNVNSGDTTTSPILNNPLIRMYRSEELIKVLIHETIHCGGFESQFGGSPSHGFKLFNTKTNSKNLLFNETIAETLAEFINCILYSIINNKRVDEILKKEIDFGFIQSAKILDHFGFISINDFLNNRGNDTRKIQQKTAVFEYHILKSVLLYGFDQFTTILLNRGNTNDIMKLIIKTMHYDEIYKNKIDNNIKNLTNLSSGLKSTFRMTTVEVCDIDEPDSICQSLYGEMKGGSNQSIIDHKYQYLRYRKKYISLKNENINNEFTNKKYS